MRGYKYPLSALISGQADRILVPHITLVALSILSAIFPFI